MFTAYHKVPSVTEVASLFATTPPTNLGMGECNS
jgi:hypothetical protein